MPAVAVTVDSSPVVVAKTTYHRYVKRAKAAAEASGQMFDLESSATQAFIVQSSKTRKTYTCRRCAQPITGTGHSRTPYGTYCPVLDNSLSKQQWIEQKKSEKGSEAANV